MQPPPLSFLLAVSAQLLPFQTLPVQAVVGFVFLKPSCVWRCVIHRLYTGFFSLSIVLWSVCTILSQKAALWQDPLLPLLFTSAYAAAHCPLAHSRSGWLCQLPAQVVWGGLCGRRACALWDSGLPPALATQPASLLRKQAQLLQPKFWRTEPGSCTVR